MAIRTEALHSGDRQHSEAEIKVRLKRIVPDFTTAIAGKDLEGFVELLESSKQWNEPHYQLQADREAWGILSVAHRDEPKVWSAFFLAFAKHLYNRLRENPMEPLLWNFLGVALFELGQDGAADRCFRTVLRIQENHPNAEGNRQQVKRRKQAGPVQLPFPAVTITQAKQLAKDITSLADRTRLPHADDMKISLAMIVKNEESVLADCLQSAQGLVDEMIVVDTGSTDRTVEIAKEFGAKVVDFPWTGSFSEARNVSLEHATGDWVLQLDADEQLIPEQHSETRALLAKTYREGFVLIEHNYTGTSDDAPVIPQAAMRIWRNRPQYRFSGIIHEQKNDSMPTWLAERFEETEINILHFGYLKEVVHSKNKSQRNMDLLFLEAEKDPNPFNSFNLGTEYIILEDYQNALHCFEMSWNELEATDSLADAGYASLLAARRARSARRSGNRELAIRYADQGLQLFPDSTELIMEKARSYEELGEHQQAMDAARQAIELGEAPAKLGGAIGNGSFLAREFIGAALERQGRPGEAADIYRQSMQADPHYLAVLGGLSRALLMSGKPVDEVLDEVEPFLLQNLAAAGAIVATRIYERGEIEAAKALYQRVEDAAPGNPLIRVGLVECLLSQGELDQALELCQPLEPGNPVAHVLLRTAAFCYILKGDLAQAENLLARSEELELSQDEAFVLQSWAELLQGGEPKVWNSDQAELAAPLLESVLRLQNFDAAQGIIRLYYNSAIGTAERTMIMAPIFARQGYLDSAAECWLEWIDQDGPQVDSLVGLAYISRAEERFEEALALAQDATSLDPSHQEAQRMVEAFASWPGK